MAKAHTYEEHSYDYGININYIYEYAYRRNHSDVCITISDVNVENIIENSEVSVISQSLELWAGLSNNLKVPIPFDKEQPIEFCFSGWDPQVKVILYTQIANGDDLFTIEETTYIDTFN